MILIDGIWKKLENEHAVGGKIVARLAFPEVSRKLYAGLDSKKQRHLLIPLRKDDEEYTDLKSRGFSIVTKELAILGFEPNNYIDIICLEDSGYAIFDAIAKEIAEKLDQNEPKEIVTKVISKWRYFWGQNPRELLSYEEIIGLFAELWFLYHWLFPRLNKLEAINRWRGPFSSRHDFEWQGKSVEVKATTNVQNRVHKIHSIDQLSPPENGELLLFSMRIREEQGSENTLPTLIVCCQDMLKNDFDALSRFESTLVMTGYSPIHNDEYFKLKFRVVDEKLYSVTGDFPRLLTTSFKNGIPNGVASIEYSINLDGFDRLCIAKSPTDDIKF